MLINIPICMSQDLFMQQVTQKEFISSERMNMVASTMGSAEYWWHVKGIGGEVGLRAYFGASSKWYWGPLIFMEKLIVQITTWRKKKIIKSMRKETIAKMQVVKGIKKLNR